MATIIAGGFETHAKAEDAVRQLGAAGINEEYLCEFAINPPGMHDALPLGGDHDESMGAHKADDGATKGAAIGATVGTVVGAIAAPLVGPAGIVAGAGAGAYAGSLVGGLKGGIDQEVQPGRGAVRPAEAMVAVNIDGAGVSEDHVIEIFEHAGAWQVERANGTWESGEWKDFDPVSRPRLIGNGRAA